MIFIVVISTLYAIFIAWLIAGWHKTPRIKTEIKPPMQLQATVVVACKNESEALPSLFEALKNQTNQNFQLILVDDHSTDNSYEIMHSAKDLLDVLVLKSEAIGKKHALKTGIQHARNEFIITTDADCMPTETWIDTMYQFYNQQNLDLLIGPVALKSSSSFWERIQQLEFQTLIASGGAAAGHKHAIMCNGANLGFHKSEWLNHFEELKPHLQSGDDVFLLHAMKKQRKNIAFVGSQQAMVYTNACKSLGQFFKQRRRWASKAPAYTDFDTILIALFIFATSFTQVSFAVFSLFNSVYLVHYLYISSIKLVLDWIFIEQTMQLFEKRKTALSTLTLAVLYPFYIVSSAIAGILQGIIDIHKDKNQLL